MHLAVPRLDKGILIVMIRARSSTESQGIREVFRTLGKALTSVLGDTIARIYLVAPGIFGLSRLQDQFGTRPPAAAIFHACYKQSGAAATERPILLAG